ncbi:MAG TPA: hypothetical protein VHX62_09620 [Solirubrobacteraceae bacterium]|nr:hypothetical protein [Solirubrobacteraceae bacterium]
MATAHPTARGTAYPASARTADRTTATRTEKGISLARGPALILGTILTAAGLYLLYKAHTFPKFSNFPNGSAPADGKFIFGLFAANGWTGMLTAVAGGLLLFGAAQHLLAKTMSLIVGVALGAAAVIALISGNVLGLAAANGWTELGWAVCAVILLFNTLTRRRRRTVVVSDAAVADDALVAREPVTTANEPVTTTRAANEPMTTTRAANEPMTTTRAANEPMTTTRAANEPVTTTRAAGEPVVRRSGGQAVTRDDAVTRDAEPAPEE